MAICLLGLGANLDDRQLQLETAVALLRKHPALSVRAVSGWHVTPPVGGPPGQADYLNGAALVETSLGATDLFRTIQSIERQLGRERRQRWGARRIDIDILLFDDLVCRTRDLQIPHPWLAVRRFVLKPAAEIAAQLRHPLLGWTVGRLADHLEAAPPRFALTGLISPQIVAKLAEKSAAAPVVDPLTEGRTCGGESTRPNYRQQIEFLVWRGRRLVGSDWSERAGAAVSGFWLEESRLAAREALNRAEREAFEAQFESLAVEVPPPKLLILWLAHGIPQWMEPFRITPDTYRQIVKRHVASLDLFPMVEITAVDVERFVQEAAAAVSAMQ